MARATASGIAGLLAQQPQRPSARASRDQFGEIRAVDSNGTVTYEVRLDGAEGFAPCTCTCEVHHGDRVLCHIVNHRIVVFSNVTSPSINDDEYPHVKDIAEEANDLLDTIAVVEQEAHDTFENILADASEAAAVTGRITDYEAQAHESLENILDSAMSAAGDAATAKSMAQSASTSAASALASATAANSHANEALVQLSVVQDVAGTLDWISDHGTFSRTQDQAIVDGKVYFTYDSQTGDYSPVAEPRVEDISTYYELDITDSQTDYIMAHLAVTSRGLWVLPSGKASGTTPASGETQADSDCRQASNYKTLLSNSGMEVFDGSGASVALFGPTTRIGKASGESHMLLDYHSMQMVDKEGNTYFHVSDLRDSSGEAQVSMVHVSTGTAMQTIDLSPRCPTSLSSSITVSVPDFSGSIWGWETGDTVGLDIKNVKVTGVPSGDAIYISYRTTYRVAGATLGTRTSSATIGDFSFSSGAGNAASGNASHAEGAAVTASGYASHAEGEGTVASGLRSHAEASNTVASGIAGHAEGEGAKAIGTASHAEGRYTVASGMYSHAEGVVTTASGSCSHAQNAHTIAASSCQTAIGEYNVEDANDKYAAIIGNGTSDSARSNALAVRWDGHVDIADKMAYPYLVFGSLAWTSANLSACKAAVADYRPCVARFSNGAVVEFDGDPQTDSFS